MTLYGHPLAKELEAWWAEHAGRHADTQWHRYIETYRALISDKYDELLEEHDNGGRFGMSKAGGCTRAAQLKLLGFDGSPLSGSSRATFFIGHTVEVMALASLMTMGYTVADVQGRVVIEPFAQSAIDGRLLLHGTETLLSIKSTSYKKSGKAWGKKGEEPKWERRGFPELPFEGVRSSQPGYWADMQAGMHATRLAQGIIIFVAKDMVKAMEGDPYLGPEGNGSLTFYAELVEADPQFIQDAYLPAWSEAWQSVESGVPGRGLYIHKADNRYVELSPLDAKANMANAGMKWNPCSYCDFADACHGAITTAQLRASIAQAEAQS